MSKPLLFVDFNGVLSYDPFWKSLKNQDHVLHKRLKDIEQFLFKSNFNLVQDWMLGKSNSEKIHQIIADKLNLDYQTLFKIFIYDCEQMTISERILKELKLLKSKYTLILATGNMDSFDRFTLPAHKYLYDIFDEIHNSFNLRLLKTTNNGEYFQNTIQKYNVDITKSYLIDDSGSTCTVFSNLGGTSLKTKTENEVIDVMIKYLR